jgi:hypothetical protein
MSKKLRNRRHNKPRKSLKPKQRPQKQLLNPLRPRTNLKLNYWLKNSRQRPIRKKLLQRNRKKKAEF